MQERNDVRGHDDPCLESRACIGIALMLQEHRQVDVAVPVAASFTEAAEQPGGLHTGLPGEVRCQPVQDGCESIGTAGQFLVVGIANAHGQLPAASTPRLRRPRAAMGTCLAGTTGLQCRDCGTRPPRRSAKADGALRFGPPCDVCMQNTRTHAAGDAELSGGRRNCERKPS